MKKLIAIVVAAVAGVALAAPAQARGGTAHLVAVRLAHQKRLRPTGPGVRGPSA
jgi:hypothetical protein